MDKTKTGRWFCVFVALLFIFCVSFGLIRPAMVAEAEETGSQEAIAAVSQDEIDTVAVLQQQIDEYERMKDFSDEGRTESLQALIEKTE